MTPSLCSRATVESRRAFLALCGAVGAFLRPQVVSGFKRPEARSGLVRFGVTDLYVSRLCQGTAFRQVTRNADDPNAQTILHRCLDLGVNFFDSSNAYGWGGAEMALGKAIRAQRDKVVICTKVSPHLKPEPGVAERNALLTRDFIFTQVE
jgi:aryl-alcohol dehydrogenase-like predicted oxidoreductase